MKIYMYSSASSDFGSLGRGWHESDVVSKRNNVPEKDVVEYFKSLIKSDQATDIDRAEKTNTLKAKTATNKKLSK